VTGGEFYRAFGGKGANQAVAAGRAALEPVIFVGAVGDDELGTAAAGHLRSENLVCDYLKTVPGVPSGVALIVVDEAGQNLISVAAGANARLIPRDLDTVPNAAFAAARVFLISLETPLETVIYGLRRAKSAGLLTVLNPAPATRSILESNLLTLVDVITPNEGEAALLTADDTREASAHDEESALGSARRLQSLGCRQVVVTLGSAGCLVVDEQPTRISGRTVRAVDATAAGDAFNGALAVGLSEGRSLVEAARWANAAAALSVTRRGAQSSLPTRREIDAFS
jgi:ribokinase